MALSLRQVAAANRETARAEKLSNWSVFLLYRQLGTLLAWLLLKTRLSPTNVSVIGLGVAGLMPLVAGLLPIGAAGIVLFWLAVLFQILDCSDGAMARAGGTGSAAGARYDFLIDMFQWGVLYASMGLLADRMADGGAFWTMLGFAAGWLRLFARVCNDAAPKKTTNAAGASLRLGSLMWFLNGLSGLIPLLLLSGPYMYVAVIAVLVYSIGDVLDALSRVVE